MQKKIPYSDFSINSIIGTGDSIKGEFNLKGTLRIDGYFYGKINSQSKVYIGKTGKVEATIIAKNIIVGGVVKGDIFAEENIVVLKTAEIIGNIYSCSINMDDGVIFAGECRVLNKDDMKELAETKRKEKNNI
ncbi:MAG TPA: polymer-forming cytoskeletal protein [Spirochaetota bacterium]|nr:polymer-forming cytoskeletal protein [Spirochaetota bacterium]HOL58097.1 polymer-forming cytoskeletal protein [Spirochaetota bacterium]HPP05171.1 polymer-forming cytoskeletal protein [Spirochaetota bacterium]